ncbi:hypothetical protein DSECCO2_407040 [anaerobic digester metagenome]
MLDQRIEPLVLGNDVEIGLRVLCGQLADIEGDMEIQGVGPVAGYLHVLGAVPHFLHGRYEFEGQLVLIGADEDENLEMLGVQSGQRLELNVFVVNENIVRAQDHSPL